MSDREPFTLFDTYVAYDGFDAERVPVSAQLWDDLMSGRRRLDGLLVSAFRMTGDADNWEIHPAGDELLILISGALDIVLDEDGAERAVTLSAGQGFVVPKGTWHRFVVREPGELYAVTPGAGTDHRPVGKAGS